jgi:methionyl-tRNA synthetase
VRYSLLRNLSFASDGDFSMSELIRSYNEELGNDLGNLLNRVVSMIQRYRKGSIPTVKTVTEREEDLQRIATETRQAVAQALDAWDIGGALNVLWQLVRRANQYIEQSEPWKLAKQLEQQEQLDTVLYSAAESLRLIALLLAPFIPTTTNRILAQLGKAEGVRSDAWIQDTGWGNETLTKVVPGNVLFPRIE